MMQMPEGWFQEGGNWYYEFGKVLFDDGTNEFWKIMVRSGYARIGRPIREQEVSEYIVSSERYKALLEGALQVEDEEFSMLCFRAYETIRQTVLEVVLENPELEREVLQKTLDFGWTDLSEVAQYIADDSVVAAYADMLTQDQREELLWQMMSSQPWSFDGTYRELPTLISWMGATFPHRADMFQLFAPQIHEACKGFHHEEDLAKQYILNFVNTPPSESFELPALD